MCEMDMSGLIQIKEESDEAVLLHIKEENNEDDGLINIKEESDYLTEDAPGYEGVFEDTEVKEEPLECAVENYEPIECMVGNGNTPGIIAKSLFGDADFTFDESPWVKEEVCWHGLYDEVDDENLSVEEGSEASLLLIRNVKKEGVADKKQTRQRKCGKTNASNQVESNKVNTRARKIFSCSKCGFECRTAFYLTEHMGRKHTKSQERKTNRSNQVQSNKNARARKIFSCRKCGFECRTAFYLTEHMEKKHSKYQESKAKKQISNLQRKRRKPLTCDLCKFSCFSKNRLSEHIQTHVESELFHCNICDFKSTSICDLKRHTTKHKRECACVCDDRRCQNPGEMKEHDLTHLEQLICESCGIRHKCSGDLEKHRELPHHGSDNHSLNEGQQSDLAVDTSVNLGAHMPVKTNMNPYACGFCYFTCEVRQDFETHVKNSHSLCIKYDCPDCGFSSTEISTFKEHMRSHVHVDEAFNCKICGYESLTQTKLIHHMSSHCTSVCNLCGISTDSSRQMNLHWESHHGGYECDVCGNKFHSGRKLSIHRYREHSFANLEPLACKFCDYRCSSVGTLIAHSATHSGGSSSG